MEETKWCKFKNFVNENVIFTTKALKNYVGVGQTANCYLNITKNAGFVKRIEVGKYERVIKIPLSWATGKMLKFAYTQDKTVMNRLIRTEKLNNINKNENGK